MFLVLASSSWGNGDGVLKKNGMKWREMLKVGVDYVKWNEKKERKWMNEWTNWENRTEVNCKLMSWSRAFGHFSGYVATLNFRTSMWALLHIQRKKRKDITHIRTCCFPWRRRRLGVEISSFSLNNSIRFDARRDTKRPSLPAPRPLQTRLRHLRPDVEIAGIFFMFAKIFHVCELSRTASYIAVSPPICSNQALLLLQYIVNHQISTKSLI